MKVVRSIALTICDECKKTVSTNAKRCPHCGAPVEIKEESIVTDKEIVEQPKEEISEKVKKEKVIEETAQVKEEVELESSETKIDNILKEELKNKNLSEQDLEVLATKLAEKMNNTSNEITDNSGMVEVDVIKEKCNVFISVITFIVSAIMAVFYLIDEWGIIKVGKEMSLIELIKMPPVLIFALAVAIIVFISFVLKLISRTTNIISKIGYMINTIMFTVVFFVGRYFRISFGYQFFILFGLNILLFLIPRIDKIVSVKEYVFENEVSKIETKNKQKKKKYENKKNKLPKLIINIVLSLASIVIFIVSFTINQSPIKTYEDNKKDGIAQIVITEESLNIRKSPNLQSQIVGFVYEDDVINVIDVIEGESYYWYKVKINGIKGYIANPKANGKNLKYKSNGSTSNGKQSVVSILEEKGYSYLEENVYARHYTNSDGTITQKVDLNENIMYSYAAIDNFETITTYKYDEQTANYMYKYSSYGTDYYGSIDYNVKTKKHTCSSSISTWCNSSDDDAVTDMILPVIEEFDEIMQGSKNYDYI